MDDVRLVATEDRVILRELHEAGGKVSLYDLHKRYGFSPGQTFSASQKLIAMGLAFRDGITLQETDLGFELCVTSAQDFWPQLESLAWKEVPAKIRPNTEATTALYCPIFLAKENK